MEVAPSIPIQVQISEVEGWEGSAVVATYHFEQPGQPGRPAWKTLNLRISSRYPEVPPPPLLRFLLYCSLACFPLEPEFCS